MVQLDYEPVKARRTRRDDVILAVGLLGIFAAHAVVQFLVYPECVLAAVGAGAGYGFLYTRYLPGAEETERSGRVGLVAILTLITTVVSWWGSMVIPVNMFGT